MGSKLKTALLYALVIGGFASMRAVADTSWPLAIVAVDGVTSDIPYYGVYDFGSVLEGTKDAIRHDFLVKNLTGHVVTIAEVRPSCGCTTAIVDGAGSLAPGGQATIHVTVDASRLAPPSAEKTVGVYLSGELTPSATLLIKGNVTQALAFDPPVIDFASVRSGTSPSIALKVTMDTRAYPKLPSPEANSSVVSVELELGMATVTAGTLVTRTYRVTLAPHAHLGPLTGWLSVPQEGVEEADCPKAPLAGSIIGDIAPSPSEVTFGNVNRSCKSTAYADIVGASASGVTGLTAVAGSQDVQVRILPGTATGKARLEVTLSPRKRGALMSKVRVTTRSGQVLDLPVSAYVE